MAINPTQVLARQKTSDKCEEPKHYLKVCKVSQQQRELNLTFCMLKSSKSIKTAQKNIRSMFQRPASASESSCLHMLVFHTVLNYNSSKPQTPWTKDMLNSLSSQRELKNKASQRSVFLDISCNLPFGKQLLWPLVVQNFLCSLIEFLNYACRKLVGLK